MFLSDRIKIGMDRFVETSTYPDKMYLALLSICCIHNIVAQFVCLFVFVNLPASRNSAGTLLGY